MIWQSDKARADKFIPEIKRHLGEILIGEAPIEDDQQRNTDLIVLKMDSVRIGVRVRTPKYFDMYGGEFTIRADRPSGTKTELAKIIEGWGNYIFYGHSDHNEQSLRAWAVGDLNVFRLWFNSQIVKNKGALPGFHKPNGDNSSSFRAFKWNEVFDGFVVASGGDLSYLTQEAAMRI